MSTPDKFDRMAKRLLQGSGLPIFWYKEVAKALRRVDRAAEKRGYAEGRSRGESIGYKRGYDDQMKARILDAKERERP